MLCKKAYCPILSKAESLVKHLPNLNSNHVDGSSPPGAFVGHTGYPRVYLGPLIPPTKGDTTLLDTPEMWLGKDILTIIDYRFSLIRGKLLVDIHEAADPSKYLLNLHDLALSSHSVEVDAQFSKKPRMVVTLSEDTQPFGPSAHIKNLTIAPSSGERKLEAVYYDDDQRAVDAITELYHENVHVSRIQRILSLGMLGLQKQRKIVPTRWSITAVDDTLSKQLLTSVKQYPPIDKFQVYLYNYLDNVYAAVLSPRNWEFEWIEAWFPGTAWNENGVVPALMGDYEPYDGRRTYASVGGCYYSCRLAAAEALQRQQRQAAVMVLREIRPGYVLPVGVWNVRESVRAALRSNPQIFDSFSEAFQFACGSLSISPERWMKNSVMIRNELFQRRLTQYFGS
jgi:hypothetical protein